MSQTIKLLMGGSPCTHWSIAQTKDRETEPSGIGWELFLNYRIARDKYKPDYFLYENNKSMAPAIRAQITKELGVEPVLINSALVSAQSRQRLYWVGKRNPDGTYSQLDVSQPEDRGILLRDILESGVVWNEKSYCLNTHCQGAIPENTIQRHQHQMVAEPVNVTATGKAYNLKASYFKSSAANLLRGGGNFSQSGAAEPVRIGTIESAAQNADFDSQQYRVYSPDGKSVTLCGNGGGVGAKTGLYAAPVSGAIRIGTMPTKNGEVKNHQSSRVYAVDGKGVPILAHPNGGGADGAATGLYAIQAPIEYNPLHSCDVVITDQNIRCTYKDGSGTAQGYSVYFDDVKAPSVITGHAHKMKVIEPATGKEYPVYTVMDGLITIKDKQYPIKLADGYYIIRKLTVRECMRLQTVPEDYIFPVSDTQAYKMLGNGWTVDVIAHILSHVDGIATEPVEVLSMYDGMSCGHIALDKLGAEVVSYHATEIDKYAIQTTAENYPDTVQLGDAFQVRENDWRLHHA